MAELNDTIKTAIVTALGRFTSPADVVAMVREEFDVEISIRQVIGYDPTRPAFSAGDKWVVIFDAVRKAYLEDVSAIPIASQSFRLNELNKLFQAAVKSKNMVLAANLMEQAAKEVGGVLTNERNLNVDRKGGGFRDLTSEERRAAAAELIREALSKDNAQNAPSTGNTQ